MLCETTRNTFVIEETSGFEMQKRRQFLAVDSLLHLWVELQACEDLKFIHATGQISDT